MLRKLHRQADFWAPRSGRVGSYVLDPTHPLYSCVLYVIMNTEGAGFPNILTGPAGIPGLRFSGGSPLWSAASRGVALNMVNSTSNILTTQNVAMFAGLTAISHVGAYCQRVFHGTNYDIWRKDGEYTMAQTSAGFLVSRIWIGGTMFTVPGSAVPGGEQDIASTWSATSNLFNSYTRQMQGPITSSSIGTSGASITGNAAKPLAMGGAEGGAEPFDGYIYYSVWFAKALTLDDLIAVWDNPWQLVKPLVTRSPRIGPVSTSQAMAVVMA